MHVEQLREFAFVPVGIAEPRGDGGHAVLGGVQRDRHRHRVAVHVEVIGQRGDGLGELLVQRGDRAQARLVFGKQGGSGGELAGIHERHPLEAVAPAVPVMPFFGSQLHQPLDELGIDGTA